MKSSHGSVPSGLSLYEFEYPAGHVSEETFCGGPDGACIPNPPQCFLESDTEAARFARRYGATRALHVLSGRSITLFRP